MAKEEKKYWFNRRTGEYMEHWKDPSKAGEGPGWEPADQTYVDKMKQQERYQEAIGSLKQVVGMFDKNYGKGQEQRMLAAAGSQAALSGLGGTTRAGAVSGGIKAQIEDARRGKLAEALSMFGQFLGNYRDPFAITPDVALQRQGLALQKSGQEQSFILGQRGLDLQALGQKQNYALNQGQLDLGYAQLNADKPTPAPTPVNNSIWRQASLGNVSSSNNFGSGGYTGPTGNLLGDFDPVAANARMGNTLR